MDTNSVEKMYLSSSNSSQETIQVNERNHTIHFNAGIDARTMSILMEKLLNLEEKILKKQKDFKEKIKEFKIANVDDFEDGFELKIKPKPIMLYITSNGGHVYQVFGAIDTIKSMKIPVHTVCKGFVASAATLLSLAGAKRYITESSYMLIHELRAGSWGKYTHLSESLDNSKQLMDHIKSFYLTHTNMTAKELKKQLKKDLSWNAQMCLEKGLVDEIIQY